MRCPSTNVQTPPHKQARGTLCSTCNQRKHASGTLCFDIKPTQTDQWQWHPLFDMPITNPNRPVAVAVAVAFYLSLPAASLGWHTFRELDGRLSYSNRRLQSRPWESPLYVRRSMCDADTARGLSVVSIF